MFPKHRLLRPLLAVLALAALAVGIAACGYESDETHAEEGVPVTLGELSYNVTFSRFLNPNDDEDKAYLVGQPPEAEGYDYFGVFMEIQNESDKPQTVPTMTVSDAAGNSYSAYPSESLYALQFGEEVEPEEQLPVLDSTADLGAIEGALLIFRLPTEVSEERPLTLHIEGSPKGEVTLDL
jgi:hypothetical protein